MEGKTRGNPRTFKTARAMALGSLSGWIVFYVAVVILLVSAEEGNLAYPFVHPFGAAYIASGLLGSWLMKRDGREVTGGIVILVGYIATTSTMVVLAFPLFIPNSLGFDWYVYVMLALFFTGVVGGSLVIK